MRARQLLAVAALAVIAAAATAVMPPEGRAQTPPIRPPCADCWWIGPDDARLTHARAEVAVGDGRYRTRWTLTFEHPGEHGGLAEGRVVIPLPPDSVVTDLTLIGGPQTLEGRLLDAGDAARIYDEIVRRLIDPALLRSLGGDLYEIRAFPVPAGETRQVRYTVTTPLAAEAGEVVIEAPWSRMSPRPASASLAAAVDVPWEVRTAIAPGHVPAVERLGPGTLDVSWESPEGWAAARDFRLHLAGGEGLVAARLLAHRAPREGAGIPGRAGAEDGYFALLLAPRVEAGARVARDIVVVLDRSGSMYGEKIAQARAAAVRILDDLGAGDRFGVVSFADTATAFARELRPASAAPAGKAWIGRVEDGGGTNIAAALTAALRLLPGDRPSTLVFLTDGLPTVGIADTGGIIETAEAAAPAHVQVFAFGVGYDVDTVLLDALASRFTGSSHYVTPGERIDAEVGKLSERISTPVLLSTAIEFVVPPDTLDGPARPGLFDIAPASPGGIFAGEQVLITGRYRGSGGFTAVLTGQGAAGEQRFEYALSMPSTADDPGVALLWAQRRIADLLRELRVEGERAGLIESIVAIANRFGIVTPYTAYLAEEPDAVFDQDAAMTSTASSAAMPDSGAAAVRAAEDVGDLAKGEAEHSTTAAGRLVGTRTYYLVGDTWIVEGFDLDGPAPRTVALDAARLARLRAADPHLAAASALGPRVIALYGEGWALLVWPDPADAAADVTDDETAERAEAEYVVRPGETLWRIAARCWGDGRRWPEVWDANRDRMMDDGRTFSSPHLIRVGWTLAIPGGCAGG